MLRLQDASRGSWLKGPTTAVSEFAHPAWQKWLSYITGWTSTMVSGQVLCMAETLLIIPLRSQAWQAGNALGVFLTGTLIQVIILENWPTYPFPPWQGTLLVIGCILLVGTINIFGAKLIPKVQNIIFCLHVAAYFCFIGKQISRRDTFAYSSK